MERRVLDVKGGARLTPYCTKDELDSGIRFSRQVKTNGDGCLRDHDGTNMMHGADKARDLPC